MSPGMRVVITVLVVASLSGAVGCSNDDDGGGGGGGGGDKPTREQAIEVLLQQGYTREGAECVIDNAEGQDVDVLDVFTRDQITQRELQVLATVQEFCVQRFGTTNTTVPAGAPSDTGVDSVPG